MAYTARPFGTNSLFQLVNQAHTFQVGHVVAFNGTNYVLANVSNSAIAYNTVGMVSLVPNANSFWVTQAGYVTNIVATPGLIAGTGYFLDPANAGQLTAVSPVASGQFISLCLVTDTSTSGFFFNNGARPVQSGVQQWNIISMSATMAVNEGYMANAGGTINLALPSVSVIGDTITVVNINTGNFKITQPNAGSIIQFGNISSTLGATGFVQSTAKGDTIELVCTNANSNWFVIDAMGNLTFN